MSDEAIRREYFKVHFAVDNIATAFTNKYEGTVDPICYPRRVRAREKEDRRYRASRVGTTFDLRNIAC